MKSIVSPEFNNQLHQQLDQVRGTKKDIHQVLEKLDVVENGILQTIQSFQLLKDTSNAILNGTGSSTEKVHSKSPRGPYKKSKKKSRKKSGKRGNGISKAIMLACGKGDFTVKYVEERIEGGFTRLQVRGNISHLASAKYLKHVGGDKSGLYKVTAKGWKRIKSLKKD